MAFAAILVSTIYLLVGCAEALPEAPAATEATTESRVEKRAQARAEVEDELTRLQAETRAEKDQFAEYQASTRTVTHYELDMHPRKYWNLDWDNRSLRSEVSSIRDEYAETHSYLLGESDLHAMVIDIWELLESEGITSYIVYGNQSLEYESFQQSNYAWLLIYARSSSFTLDCETGRIGSGGGQYGEGYIYLNPSDFRADLLNH